MQGTAFWESFSGSYKFPVSGSYKFPEIAIAFLNYSRQAVAILSAITTSVLS